MIYCLFGILAVVTVYAVLVSIRLNRKPSFRQMSDNVFLVFCGWYLFSKKDAYSEYEYIAFVFCVLFACIILAIPSNEDS